MGRKPSGKPWLHSPSGYWCVTLDGKREYLDKDYQVAGRKLKALIARRKRELAGGREWLDQPFSVLADEYMADIKARKKPATYISVRYSLLRALKILGSALRVAEIRKLHLAKIEQSLTKAKYSSTTVKHTIAAVQGVFHWAVKHEVLDGNPLVGYEKPKAHRRTRVITPDEYGKLLAKADPNFGRVITALRMTGCRPGEVRTLDLGVGGPGKQTLDHSRPQDGHTAIEPTAANHPAAGHDRRNVSATCQVAAQAQQSRLSEQVRPALQQRFVRP